MSARPVARSTSVPRSRVALVLFVTLMDTLGFGIMLPTLPFYARSLGADPDVVTLAMAVYTFGIFLSTPFWGRASDRLGRKPVICTGLAGSLVCYGVLAYSDSIALVIGARLAGGLMAGNLSACTAYLVDVTSVEERARVMGMSGAAFGLGFVVGPLLGSLLGGETFESARFTGPALTAAGLSLCGLVAVLAFLPESRSRADRTTALERRTSSMTDRIRNLGRPILMLAACAAFFGVASGYYETILPLWAADFGLIEGPEALWMFFLPTGVALVSVQAFAIDPLTRRFGERVSIAVAALGLAAGCLSMTVAGTMGSIALAVVLTGVMACFAAVIMATSYILMSKLVRDDERGEVLGLFSSVGTLSRTAGMVASGILYDALHPHAPYWFAAATLVATAAIATRLEGARSAPALQTLSEGAG